MNADKWEPTPEQVEREAIRLRNEWNATVYLPSLEGCSAAGDWRNVARTILQRQHEREAGLLNTLRTICMVHGKGWTYDVAASALAAHAALDAPPEPTLLEAAKVCRNFADPCDPRLISEAIEALANQQYPTPTRGCDECGVGGWHALYCVKCSEKYIGEAKC